jgi:hypothetical protein
MVKLVSLRQANRHLKVDNTDGDADMDDKIEAASALVLAYLGPAVDFLNSDGDVEEGTDGDPAGVPGLVRQAVLMQLGCFFNDREPGESLSPIVKNLLNLYGRSPVIA